MPNLREGEGDCETRSFSGAEALQAEVRAGPERPEESGAPSSAVAGPDQAFGGRSLRGARHAATHAAAGCGISGWSFREESQRGLDGQSKALQNEILGSKAQVAQVQSGASAVLENPEAQQGGLHSRPAGPRAQGRWELGCGERKRGTGSVQ